MRLFIAIDFPEKIKSDIKNSFLSFTQQFPQISWTKIDNLHLTLKFLGNIENTGNNRKDNLFAKLQDRIASSIKGLKPFRLEFGKLGLFERNYLVIWLGVISCAELFLLVERIEQETKKLGWDKERSLYSPHITVGRGKHLSKTVRLSIKQAIKNTLPFGLSPYLVLEISLMQSRLTPSGPIYTSLAKFALRKD